jgi:hypothetical protein
MIHTNKHKQEDYFYNSYLIANGILFLFVALHFYLFGYGYFDYFGLTHPYLEKIMMPIASSLFFSNHFITKAIIVVISLITFSMVKVYKNKDINLNAAIRNLVLGIIIFFASSLILYLELSMVAGYSFYIVISFAGLILFNDGMGKIFRYFKSDLKEDIFNKGQETFPQERRKLVNESSVNLPAKYNFNKRQFKSWINFVNLYRGLLVTGSPGSGKTYFVIRHIISQLINKNFTMLVYDFKYPDLSKLTYNLLREAYPKLKIQPTFYCINFDDLEKSHRVNPLLPESIKDISDAYQASKSVYYGMSIKGTTKQDPFWEDGAINALASIIWLLKKENNGKYCTFPHALEFLMGDHRKYIPVLMCDSQASKYASVLYTAMLEDNSKLLNNMMATLKQKMAKLASPNVYWIMTGNDFSLHLNNPEDPKILCLANNDQKNHVYSAPISLIIEKTSRLINRKGQLKCATVFDEFPTVYFENVANQIATARSNKIATILGLQDASQNEKNLGRIDSEIIFNITPNIISGSLSGKMAKDLSERLGKIKMVRDSVNMGQDGPTKNQSVQMDYAVPVSTINNLSSGEVVGVVADNPDQAIELKRFHSHIINDHKKLEKFDRRMEELPVVNPNVSEEKVNLNFDKISYDSNQLINDLYEKYSTDDRYRNIFSPLEKSKI